jgi:hypothetical protein
MFAGLSEERDAERHGKRQALAPLDAEIKTPVGRSSLKTTSLLRMQQKPS